MIHHCAIRGFRAMADTRETQQANPLRLSVTGRFAKRSGYITQPGCHIFRPQWGHGYRPRSRHNWYAMASCTAGGAWCGRTPTYAPLIRRAIPFHVPWSNWYAPMYFPERFVIPYRPPDSQFRRRAHPAAVVPAGSEACTDTSWPCGAGDALGWAWCSATAFACVSDSSSPYTSRATAFAPSGVHPEMSNAIAIQNTGNTGLSRVMMGYQLSVERNW